MGASTQNQPQFSDWHQNNYQNAQHQRNPMQGTVKPQQDGKPQGFGIQIQNPEAAAVHMQQPPPPFNNMNMPQQYAPQQMQPHHMGNMMQPNQQQAHMIGQQPGNVHLQQPMNQYGGAQQYNQNQFYSDQNQKLHVNPGMQQNTGNYPMKQSFNDMNSSLNSNTAYPQQQAQSNKQQSQSNQQNSNSTQYSTQQQYYPQSSVYSQSTKASSNDGSSTKSGTSLYLLFHQTQRLNRPIQENLEKLKEHYDQKACSSCNSMVGRYNLQYYFDSEIIARPQENFHLSNILAHYCDHNFCANCLTRGIKEKAILQMKQNNKVVFDDFRCPIQITNQFGCPEQCGKRVPEKIIQHFLDGVLYKSTTQNLNKYHVQIQLGEASQNGQQVTNANRFNPPKPNSDACRHCKVIHNANQGVYCETIDHWRRVYKFSKSQQQLEDVVIPQNTEVMGHVIVDKETIKFFKQEEQLRQFGLLGIYPYEQKVDRALWQKQKSYLHSIENNNFATNNIQFEPFTRDECIKIEWNYMNMNKAITRKDHANMSAEQQRNLLQWRQKLDDGLECEFMMYDNDPKVENIYLRQNLQSLWILREIKDAQRPIRKIQRDTKPGEQHNVLVLVGTKCQFDALWQKLPHEKKKEQQQQQSDLIFDQTLLSDQD